MLYSDLSDAKIFEVLARKLNGLKGNGSTSAKNNMPAVEWFKLFKVGDGTCQYSGETFDDIKDMSFERVDPRLPYQKGNVLIVKNKYNDAKSYIDRLLHCDKVSDEMAIKLLKEGIKVIKARVKKRMSDANKELASQAANQNLRVAMFTTLKRGRFSDKQAD